MLRASRNANVGSSHTKGRIESAVTSKVIVFHQNASLFNEILRW